MVIVNATDSVMARIQAEKENLESKKKRLEMEEYLKRTGELSTVNLDEVFTYESGNVKTNQGFALHTGLKINLDKFLVKSVANLWDGIFIMSGMEGCLRRGERILLADGTWKNVEDIVVGDIVMSPQFDGSYKYSKVLNTNKWYSKENYSIKERGNSNKRLYNCSYNHGLPFYFDKNKVMQVSAQDFFKLKDYKKQEMSLLTSFKIPKFMNRENCKIEPYTLGAFIGDGSFIGSHLTIANSINDKEMIKEVKRFYKPMSEIADKRQDNVVINYCFSSKSLLWKQLTECALRDKRSADKFIPREALLSDVNYRIRLLSGLIDSDGSIHKNTYSIKTKSKQLAEDIKDLVYSLGGKAIINIDDWAIKNLRGGSSNRYYRISFHISNCKLQVKVKRKIKTKEEFYDSNKIKIDIKKDKEDFVYGFLLDSPSHLFITNEWCLSFNSGKSTFGAALCRYLDPEFPGEPIGDGTARRHCDRIVFTPAQFSEAVAKSKPKQAIQFDEAILGLMAGDAGTNVQRMLMKEITLIRKKQLYIVLVIPSIFSMRMPIAVQRSRFLIHTYSPDGIERGYFKFYNYPTKRNLYIKGKKDYNQDTVDANFRGTFVNTEGLFFCHKEYDKKKENAIKNLTDASSGKKGAQVRGIDYKTAGQRSLLLYYLYSILGGENSGKEQLEHLVKLHNEFVTADKGPNSRGRLTPPKFSQWLEQIFGEHMKITEKGIRDYLKDAVEFTSKPLNPLGTDNPEEAEQYEDG